MGGGGWGGGARSSLEVILWSEKPFFPSPSLSCLHPISPSSLPPSSLPLSPSLPPPSLQQTTQSRWPLPIPTRWKELAYTSITPTGTSSASHSLTLAGTGGQRLCLSGYGRQSSEGRGREEREEGGEVEMGR